LAVDLMVMGTGHGGLWQTGGGKPQASRIH
jgi:hypothetical protein